MTHREYLESTLLIKQAEDAQLANEYQTSLETKNYEEAFTVEIIQRITQAAIREIERQIQELKPPTP